MSQVAPGFRATARPSYRDNALGGVTGRVGRRLIEKRTRHVQKTRSGMMVKISTGRGEQWWANTALRRLRTTFWTVETVRKSR
jgi:hypothetical protein